jgi:hypothetical protein
VDIPKDEDILDTCAKLIKCRQVEKMPRNKQVYPITAEKKKYYLDFYVDGEAAVLHLEPNLCAEYAYSVAGAVIQPIFGDVVVVDKKGNLTKEDWKNICQAVYYNDELKEANFQTLREKIE